MYIAHIRTTAWLWYLLTQCLYIQAQDCHQSLRGYVYDTNEKAPLEFATVFITELKIGTQTDENGYFSFNNLCSDITYTVEFIHLECAHETQKIQLTENEIRKFFLKHQAELAEVVITEHAVAPKPTQSKQSVSYADLETGKTTHLAAMLQNVPGVTSLSSGATIGKPVIQGLHSNRISIVQNGVTLQSQQWGSDHAPEIDPFSTNSITVIKGAAGVQYGAGALAGVIVIEPEMPREQTGYNGWIHSSAHSNGRGGAAAAAVNWKPNRGQLAYRLQGSWKRSGNLKTPDYWLGNTGNSESNLSLIVRRKKNDTDQSIQISLFNQTYAILRASHTGSLSDLLAAVEQDTPRNNLNYFTYEIDRPKQMVRHLVGSYKVHHQLNKWWNFNGQYNFQYNLREEFDRGRQSTIQGEKPQVTFQLWSNTLDLALQHLPYAHWEGNLGIQTFQQLNFVTRGGFIPDYLTMGSSLWATERWRRYPTPWEFEGGVRFDYRWSHITTTGSGNNNLDKKINFFNGSGNAGTLYHLNPFTTIKLNTGIAWRPPHINELYAKGVHHGTGTYEQGNPDMVAEVAWNTGLTFEIQHHAIQTYLHTFVNQVNNFIYLNQPKDSIVLTIRGPFPAYFYDQNDASLHGNDGSISARITKNLWTETRWSVVRARKTNPGKKADWLPLIPADRIQYGLRLEIPNKHSNSPSFIRLTATTVNRQSRIPDEGLTKEAPPAYTLLQLDGLHALQTKIGTLQIGLNITNLTNQKYRDYLNFFRFYADEVGINTGLTLKLIF
jgi:iron complex outermembrane receptor protein